MTASGFNNREMVNLENALSSITINGFESYTYNLNNNQIKPVSSIVASLGLKHALNIDTEVWVDGEKGYFIDEKKRGFCYIGNQA